MKRAALHNLGCKVNAYETEKMKMALENAGYCIVPFSEEADVYVVNTCSVTAIADKKSRQMLRRARRKSPDAVVVAAGCFVEGTDIDLAALGCDLLLKNDEKPQLVEKLAEILDEKGTDGETPGEKLPHILLKDRTRAFVKIQDGCDRFCSYCIIPYLRGRSRSRAMADVLEEINGLCEDGYQEIVLTGIHVSSYRDEEAGLIDLCEAIDRETDVKRLRLSSLEPKIVDEDFVKRLSQLSSICPHFHLSLQSGSDGVLARMNRRYTTEEFARGVALLREAFDHPAITTDVIAGFPGETEAKFAEGKAFLERMAFYEMHVFPYSRRPGTRADAMEGQVPKHIKQERAGELIALADRMSEAYRAFWKGKEVEVLFEREECVGEERVWSGFSREYVRVSVVALEGLSNCIRRVVYR